MKNKIKQFFAKVSVAVVALSFALALNYVYAWTGPTDTPPNNNVSAPINVSAITQTKPGALGLNNIVVAAGATFMGNVGIGTTDPLYQMMILRRPGSTITESLLNLQSQTSGSVDGDSFISYGTQSANWSAGVDQADSNKFRIEPALTLGAATGLTITTGGNVGIGTTGPGEKLHVADLVSTVGNPTIRLEGYAGGYGAGIEAGSAVAGGSYLAMGKAVWDGENAWNTTASTQDSFFTISTALNGALGERLRITSGGNVGIGTLSPTAKLHVAGVSGTDGIRFPDGTLQTTAAVPGGGGLQSMQVFDAPGTFTWTRSPGITKIKITVVGGGARTYSGAFGGGGGGACIKFLSTPPSNASLTVGAGATVANSSGGTSRFDDPGVGCSATGGGGVNLIVGGVGSNGDLNIRGGAGVSAGNAGSSILGGSVLQLSVLGSGVGSYGAGGVDQAGANGVVIVEEY